MRRGHAALTSARVDREDFRAGDGHGRDVEDLFEWWSERAAIREFTGGVSRADADVAAFDDLRRMLDAH